MKYSKTIILIFILLFLVSACKNEEVVEEKTVKIGSTVTFDYALGFDNGTLLDTSFEEAARQARIYDPNRIYRPAKAVIGTSPLMIGAAEALIGMKEGEIKNIRIPPRKAYGVLIENSTENHPFAGQYIEFSVVVKGIE